MARAPLPEPRSAHGPLGGLFWLLRACMHHAMSCSASASEGKSNLVLKRQHGCRHAEDMLERAGVLTNREHLLSKVNQKLCLWSWNEHSRSYSENEIPPMRRPCEILQGHPAWAFLHHVSMLS